MQHFTEVCFAGVFTIVALINLSESKLAKGISVHCSYLGCPLCTTILAPHIKKLETYSYLRIFGWLTYLPNILTKNKWRTTFCQFRIARDLLKLKSGLGLSAL